MWKKYLFLIMLFCVPLVVGCPSVFYPGEDVILDDQIVSSGVGAGCNATLYNGSMVIFNNSPMVQSGLSYSVNFSRLPVGNYQATFECLDEGIVYADSCSFEVGGDETVLGWIVFIPLIFSLLLIVVAALLSNEHNILKWGMLFVALYLGFESVNWGINVIGTFFGLSELIGMMGDFVFEVGIVLLFILFYFMIYLIKKLFDNTQKRKQEKLEML